MSVPVPVPSACVTSSEGRSVAEVRAPEAGAAKSFSSDPQFPLRMALGGVGSAVPGVAR